MSAAPSPSAAGTDGRYITGGPFSAPPALVEMLSSFPGWTRPSKRPWLKACLPVLRGGQRRGESGSFLLRGRVVRPAALSASYPLRGVRPRGVFSTPSTAPLPAPPAAATARETFSAAVLIKTTPCLSAWPTPASLYLSKECGGGEGGLSK